MDSGIAEEFRNGFDDSRYPAEFTGQYEAMECLSSGRYGETLLVREKANGRLLVAKCYERGHRLFESTEPEALRGLSHPGIPAFVGELHSPTMRCILRESVHGNTLLEFMQGSSFAQETVRSVGAGLCEILKYLHSRVPPVIHRDIKPQNVVVRGDGSPALIDLGISRLYVRGARSDTVFCGTQDFAPPEQYGFLQTDCRSDIYSLGILLAWMLTGKAAPIGTPHTSLERVIAKCTAFAPEKRFRGAAAVERALLGTIPKRRKRKRRILLGTGILLVLALLTCSGVRWKTRKLAGPSQKPVAATSVSPQGQVSQAGFSEPLIEEAVRLMLGKNANAPISPAELASIMEIYITKDTVCADIEAFYETHEEQCAVDFHARGPITSLRDVSVLPNLRTLCIASQQITDITRLKSLLELAQVDLRFNSITDITPLAGLENLKRVGLNTNPTTDITPLISCPALSALDFCDMSDYDGSDLARFGNLEFLDISNATDSYLFLGGKSITELKISNKALTDLSFLRDVKGIRKLEISGTQLTDLSELEYHPEITYLRLSRIPATDFSVLLALPDLETVVAGSAERAFVEPVAALGTFEVIYE